MRMPNPTMSSTSDYMLIFSNYFRPPFKNNFASPKNIERLYLFSTRPK